MTLLLPRLPLALAASILAMPLAGVCQSKKVIPPAASSADQAAYVDMPFTVDVGRFQHLVAGSAFTANAALLTGFSYRIDRALGNQQKGRNLPSLSVSVGYAATTPATMSTTFAANISGPQTTVFSGSYKLPDQPNLTGPGPFNIRFAWTRPFVYARSKGDLLIELDMPGQLVQLHWYPLDGYAGGPGGSVTKFGAKGPFVAGDTYEAIGLSPYLLHPGGQATLGVDDLKQNRPAVALFGFSKTNFGALTLPFDLTSLGAPGNWLAVSIDIALPLPLAVDPKGTYAGSAALAIPQITIPAGTRLYGQALFADPPSNALGLVFSNGVEMRIDAKPGAPTNCLASATPNATTGIGAIQWGGPNGGPVIELTGAGFN